MVENFTYSKTESSEAEKEELEVDIIFEESLKSTLRKLEKSPKDTTLEAILRYSNSLRKQQKSLKH